MNLSWEKIQTLYKLGLGNLLRILIYRLSVRLGLNSACRLKGAYTQGPFYIPSSVNPIADLKNSQQQSSETFNLFGYLSVPLKKLPLWQVNPITGQKMSNSTRHWSKISHFDPEVGDIKPFWELSRMDWVLSFARQARQGDVSKIDKLNIWLEDWCKNNPPYLGPNWMCGQEASIRVMNLAMAFVVLGQKEGQATENLRSLIFIHLQRIEPTISYAIAQDNNHATSEAAALFIGGSWLDIFGCPQGNRWKKIGQNILESRLKKLVGNQGSFSQYSLNYHRMMLDTICITEVWRARMQLPAFSQNYYEKAMQATKWLFHMIDSVSGDGPNVGANDGARLLQFTGDGYRDYRSTVQMATVLFSKKLAYDEGPWNEALRVLEIELPTQKVESAGDFQADDGGFVVLRKGSAMTMMRYPRFRFRPSHADALHLDLWIGGSNILRDSGTYSYNTEPNLLNYFSGVEGHNTIQFDDQNQMRRISRFLFGGWLRTSLIKSICIQGAEKYFTASYCDRRGASHVREIALNSDYLRVKDTVEGFSKKAVLRWRLLPGDWILNIEKDAVVLMGPNQIIIRVFCNSFLSRAELKEGLESLYYLKKTSIPVLEIESNHPCTFITEISWLS